MLACLVLLLAALGIGCLVLKAGGNLVGRIIVAVLFVICAVQTVRELAAVQHPHGFEMYPGMIDSLFAIIYGTAGLGLPIAFLISFRSSPIDGSHLPPTDTTSSSAAKDKGPPRFSWRGCDSKHE